LKAEMRLALIQIAGVMVCALGLAAQGPPTPPKAEGIPPRAAPADYQFHKQVGTLTIAAEFTGHAVGTPEGTLTSDDYVVTEMAMYGPPDARAQLAAADFSLRVNGGKKSIASQPYELVVKTLRDFQLEPTAAEQKEKSGSGSAISTGGQSSSSTPPPYRVPDAVRHEWRQRLQKASLPEGGRALPQAGLIYFPYRGKTEKIQSLELTYAGPAGQFTIALQP
jgi:hypothetical protein